MKRIGPELKMPDLKGLREASAPAWLADLYFDLRERRLLLPIALVVVAIAAVPFLLGDSEDVVVPPPAEDIAAGEAAIGAGSTELAVVEARPGLRDYKKRLGQLSPTDPFVQKYTGVPRSSRLEEPQGSSGGGGSEKVTVEDGSTTVEVETGDPSGGSGGTDEGGSKGGDGSGGSAPNRGGLRLIEYRFTMQLSRTVQAEDGGREWTEPRVRKGVKLLTQLPGKKNVVATVGGINFRNGKVYFLVSDEVKSLDGEFNCVTRTPKGLCELLEIETGFPLELVAGANDVRYRIKVTKIDAVWAGRPDKSVRFPRANFGPVAKSLP